MLTTAAGPEGILHSGSTVDLPSPWALALRSGGYAKAVEPDEPEGLAAEVAVYEPRRETAALRFNKKGRR